jgi:hypothetical protein
MLEVSDEVKITGELDKVYKYFWHPEWWTRLTTHVKAIEMIEEESTYQRFKMDVESDGKLYNVETERWSVPYRKISYEQCRPPIFLKKHQGLWEFRQEGTEVVINLKHIVEIDEMKAIEVLPVSTAEDAEQFIGKNLKRNGLKTINAVKAHLENH